MSKHEICYLDELPPDDFRIVEIEGRSIGVFNVDGSLHAVRNRCPHKGAPLCLGLVKGLVVASEPYEYEIQRVGEILRCPWHGWEFDLKTGASVFNPHRVRVKHYDVTVETPRSGMSQSADVDDDDPSIETYDVSIEADEPGARSRVFVHLT